MNLGQTPRPVLASKWMQGSVSAPNTYRGSSPMPYPAGSRSRSAERAMIRSRPRSSFAPSYRPNQRSGSTRQSHPSSYARARGRGRAEEHAVTIKERRRVSNQSVGAARQRSHDRNRNRVPRMVRKFNCARQKFRHLIESMTCELRLRNVTRALDKVEDRVRRDKLIGYRG